MIIRSKAPVRISFAGGGTDVSPFCEEYGSSVVNVSINKYVWSTLNLNREKGIVLESLDTHQRLQYNNISEVRYDGKLDFIKSVVKRYNNLGNNLHVYLHSDVPPSSGLGSSSSEFVSMIGLFNHLQENKRLTNYEIAELAFKLEREELGYPGGWQDQYAAVFGGLNFLEFKGDNFIRVNPIRLRQDTLLELEKHIVLAYLGKRKTSGTSIIEDQTQRMINDKGETLQAFKETKAIAEEVKSSLLSGDLELFGRLMEQSWLAKKKFSSLISNRFVDRIYQTAKNHGAIGGKITGAGGGGHMIFYCNDNTEQNVARALTAMGVNIIPFQFDFKGLQTWEVQK